MLDDGTALASGFVKDTQDYHGHLGFLTGVKKGKNEYRTVSSVRNEKGDIKDAPQFEKVFAGVDGESPPGSIHSIFLDRQGRAWAAGSNSKGQLCLGDDEHRLLPNRIPIDDKIVDVAIGGQHTLLLTENGDVYGCGSNKLGQLGLGKQTKTVDTPTKWKFLKGKVSSISSGRDHSLITADDGLYVTGSNEFGQLCADTDSKVFTPEKLTDIKRQQVASFEAIKTSSYIVYTDGSASACGRNNVGQLGDGTKKDKGLTEVDFEDASAIVGVGPSAESVFFWRERDQTLWGTGLNENGQLGVGDKKDRKEFTKVDTGGPIELSPEGSISAGEDHTLIIFDENAGAGDTAPPTELPTTDDTDFPTGEPTALATTEQPTSDPPTYLPTYSEPTFLPTMSPTIETPPPTSLMPTVSPTLDPTSLPPTSLMPTVSPTLVPTSLDPTYFPTEMSLGKIRWCYCKYNLNVFRPCFL